MKILVCVASRHGSTDEIAGCIARELQRTLGRPGDPVHVDTRPAHQIATVDGYDALVVGSAVYMGGWLPAARDFVLAHAHEIANVPAWLFSSGPLGDPPVPPTPPKDVPDLLEASKAREHRLFGGRLDPHALSFGERMIARAVRAPAGDFRNWDDVTAWAASIAHSLDSEHAH